MTKKKKDKRTNYDRRLNIEQHEPLKFRGRTPVLGKGKQYKRFLSVIMNGRTIVILAEMRFLVECLFEYNMILDQYRIDFC